MFPLPLSLGTKVFGVISIILVIVLGVGGLYGYGQLKAQEAKIQEVVNERDRANDARDQAIRANEQNLATIKELQADKIAADKIIGKLESDKKVINQHFDKLMTNIVLNPKLEDGAVAPVLRETVRTIQDKNKPAPKETPK